MESQFLSLRLHSVKLGVVPNRIISTGGGASNPSLLQILSDVFGVPVYVSETVDSAALGAAYRAAHGSRCDEKKEYIPFQDVIRGTSLKRCTSPCGEAHTVYSTMLPRFEHLLDGIKNNK